MNAGGAHGLPVHGRWALAFTLLELLIVIAVLTLLMALILPVLKMARIAAQGLVCLSNERQIGLGWAAFSINHNGWLPPLGNVGGVAIAWQFKLPPARSGRGIFPRNRTAWLIFISVLKHSMC